MKYFGRSSLKVQVTHGGKIDAEINGFMVDDTSNQNEPFQ